MTVREPRLTIRAIRPLAGGLQALGHDPAPILAAAGIDSRLLDDLDATVPMSAGVTFLTEAAHRDHLRRETAARHLADDRVAIAEVAFLLGFADLSAFYRAFRRWTGRTPAEFRRNLR